MFRTVKKNLIEWKNHPHQKPLLIRGTRQVGKSFVMEKIGTTHFEKLVIINFEFEPHFINCK